MMRFSGTAKVLGLNERQLFVVVLGHLCMVELLRPVAPTFQLAFFGAAIWTAISTCVFLRRNQKETQRSTSAP